MPGECSISSYFQTALRCEPAGIAAIQSLMTVLESGAPSTLQELVQLLKAATDNIKATDCSVIGVTSASELFMRFITLAHTELEQQDFDSCLRLMQSRGKQFLAKLGQAAEKIAVLAEPFIQDGATIMVHACSKVVMAALIKAIDNNKDFRVFLTGDDSGLAAKNLGARGIKATSVADSAIGYLMPKVDCVLLGAEGVAESGGIVNTIGSYTAAIVAGALNKPVYVLAESLKFVRFYPLGQDDLPAEYKYPASVIRKGGDLEVEHPRVDYTPPHLLNLLFTDLGILTPSAVSDELIKLYL